MAKLSILSVISSLESKIQEYEESITAMQNNVNLSENTVNTQTQIKKKNMHDLCIMLCMARAMRDAGDDELEFTGDIEKWFISTTTLTSERKARLTVTFHEGDDMIAIVSAHPKKTYAQLKKLMDDQGFKLDGSTVVRK